MYKYLIQDLYKIVLLFAALLVFVSASMAQQHGTIKGHLTDTAGHQILKDAFITVVSTSDTTLKRKSLSGADGSFEVSPLPYGIYSVLITFQGFEPAIRQVSLDKNNPFSDIGEICLKIQVKLLDSVQVDESFMILKKDTVEYNAGRFKTRDYAPLSELLERLPGMIVNIDGSVMINGQPIDKILVDGKPFFGGDPQTAMKHLPAEIIRKIQVYTSSNEQIGLPGPPPGFQNSKTINLVLKNNRRKGEFGKLSAGAGSEGTYAGSLDLSYMNGPQQISLIGDAGNVEGMTGMQDAAMSSMGKQRIGINRQWSGGINYRDSWNDRTTHYGSYSNSHQSTENTQQIHLLSLFPGDSSTSLNQNTINSSQNNSQRLNLTIERKLDESNSITFRPSFNLQQVENCSSTQGIQTYAQSGAAMYHSSGNNSTKTNNKTINAGIQYIHRGTPSKPSYTLGLDIVSDHNEYTGLTFSRTDFIYPFIHTDSLNLHAGNSSASFGISPSLTYSIPLQSHDILNLQCNYFFNSNSAINQTLKYNDATRQFDLPVEGQNNDFNNSYHTGKLSFDYVIQRNHYGITLGTGIESDHLQGKDLTKVSSVESQYTTMLPAATLNLDLGNNKNLRFNYNGKPIPLTIQQLQPVSATTDSLFIQVGNPQLKQPYMHSFSLSYTSVGMGSQKFFTATITGSLTLHSVQNAVNLLSNGAQVNMPVNLNGTGNVYASMSYTIPAPRLRSNINITGNIRYSQDPGLSNGQITNTRIVNFSSSPSWSFHNDKGIDFQVSAASEYDIIHYPTDSGRVTGYFTETISTRFSYIKRDWTVWLISFYSLNNSLPSGFQPTAPIISPALSRRLLKRKAAEIRLSVSDIMNQQSGASRIATPNSISDTRSMTRGRYALLSFTYNLSHFGK